MPNPFFQFKQFVVYHDKCAMKVGTDGVLAGAWTRVENARRMLDIGTGSGLIALMLAQRNTTASIVAVDIDEGAVVQARENVERSPWKHRIEVCREDIPPRAGRLGNFRCDCFESAVFCGGREMSATATEHGAAYRRPGLRSFVVGRSEAFVRLWNLFGYSSGSGSRGFHCTGIGERVVPFPSDLGASS